MFAKVDKHCVIDDDPIALQYEMDEVLPKWFWTRSEWSKIIVYRMKVKSYLDLYEKSERLRLIEE